MIVIVGLIVLLVAVIVAIVGVLSNAGAARPVDREFRGIRLSRHRVAGHSVPGRDRDRCGGGAGTERVAGRRSVHRGPWARRPTRTKKGPNVKRRCLNTSAQAQMLAPSELGGGRDSAPPVHLPGRWSRRRQPTGTQVVGTQPSPGRADWAKCQAAKRSSSGPIHNRI